MNERGNQFFGANLSFQMKNIWRRTATFRAEPVS